MGNINVGPHYVQRIALTQVIETSIRTILCGRFYFAVGFKNKSQGEEVFLCSVMFN